MLRVLQVHNRYRFKGGEDTVVNNEYKLLKNAGVIVEALIFENDKLSIDELVYSKAAAKKLSDVISDFKPNVIHVHNLFYRASPSILFEAKRQRIPLVFTLHNYRLICPNALFMRKGKICTKCKPLKFAYPAIRHKCFKDSHVKSAALSGALFTHQVLGTWKNKVSKYIVLTEFAKNMFLDSALNLKESQVIVKPNSTDDIGYNENTTNRKNFLYVGRLSSEKGVDILIDAFNQLPELRLDIIGTGSLEEQLRQTANENIRFLGTVPHSRIKMTIGNYKALVFPSIVYEGLPNTIIEAFSSGTPVIASDIDNINSIVTNEINGTLFKLGDSASLKETVLTFEKTNNENLYKNARLTFLKNYTHEQNTKALISVYKETVLTAK